jgi:hypothetical protein
MPKDIQLARYDLYIVVIFFYRFYYWMVAHTYCNS